MWRIFIRMADSNDWQAIWSGDGADTERDARAQFQRICARVDGVRSNPDNLNADSWVAARLEGPKTEPVEHTRRTPKHTLPFGQ